MRDIVSPYRILFHDSGTSALAMALTDIIEKSTVSNPEIILPAYACPALVSAILYANGKPVLVDFEKNKPWMDPEFLENRINGKTVAVIAVDLFGIQERGDLLRKVLQGKPIVLIEDSAQGFYTDENTGKWFGDIVVLSFGRGKPISMLTGGAILYKENIFSKIFIDSQTKKAKKNCKDSEYRIRVGMYNLILSPYLYGYIRNLSFLHIGETRYEPVRKTDCIDQVVLDHIDLNISDYMKRTNEVEIKYMELFTGYNDYCIDVVKNCCLAKSQKLLRYPVLFEGVGIRNKLFELFDASGLGISIMYPDILANIEGLEEVFRDSVEYENARAFCENLITFPTHSRIRYGDISRMENILNDFRNTYE